MVGGAGDRQHGHKHGDRAVQVQQSYDEEKPPRHDEAVFVEHDHQHRYRVGDHNEVLGDVEPPVAGRHVVQDDVVQRRRGVAVGQPLVHQRQRHHVDAHAQEQKAERHNRLPYLFGVALLAYGSRRDLYDEIAGVPLRRVLLVGVRFVRGGLRVRRVQFDARQQRLPLHQLGLARHVARGAGRARLLAGRVVVQVIRFEARLEVDAFDVLPGGVDVRYVHIAVRRRRRRRGRRRGRARR